jgi:hypothetical protein
LGCGTIAAGFGQPASRVLINHSRSCGRGAVAAAQQQGPSAWACGSAAGDKAKAAAKLHVEINQADDTANERRETRRSQPDGRPAVGEGMRAEDEARDRARMGSHLRYAIHSEESSAFHCSTFRSPRRAVQM